MVEDDPAIGSFVANGLTQKGVTIDRADAGKSCGVFYALGTGDIPPEISDAAYGVDTRSISPPDY